MFLGETVVVKTTDRAFASLIGMFGSVNRRLIVTAQFDTPLEQDDRVGEKICTFFPITMFVANAELRII